MGDYSAKSNEDLLAEHYGGMDKVPTNVLMKVYKSGSTQVQEPESIASKLLNFAKKEGPPIAGGIAGSILGAPGGPAGMIGGATLGGAAGRAWQRNAEYATGSRDPLKDTSSGNALDIGKSGLAQGAGEAVGLQAGAILKALRPIGNEVGAGAMKIAAAIPEKYGKAIMEDPSILNRAQTPEVMGKSYNAFENYTGLEGLGKKIESGAFKSADTSNSAYFDNAVDVANKVRSGVSVPPQDLYEASQMASNIKLGPFENPGMQKAVKAGVLDRAKGTIDDALEKVYPEYSSLRKGYFESKAREAASSILPTNKNGTANVLRPWAVIGDVLRGGAAHSPLLPAVSPAAWGTAIRAGSAVSPYAKLLAKLGVKVKAQDLADSDQNQ
jgi:hypothetical protein